MLLPEHEFESSLETQAICLILVLFRYEERSLGVFEAPVEDDETEDQELATNLKKLEPRQRVGR